MFFTPVLAGFALKFGPSHMFWIAIFGVTVIATLDSNSIIKGKMSLKEITLIYTKSILIA